jgi:hypothetical protein
MHGIKWFKVTEKFIQIVFIVDGSEVTVKLDDEDISQDLKNATGAFIGVLENVGKEIFQKAGV